MSATRSSLHDGPLILMYHRVAEAANDPWGLAVSPAHFAEHLDVLCRHRHTLPPGALRGRATPAPAAAVTFDDGYADNLLAAAPLLERFDVPATVFVATGYIGGGREFWWDALERILFEPADLPAVLHPEDSGLRVRLDLAASAAPAPDRAAVAGWRAYTAAPPTPRHAAYLDLWERLVNLRAAEQWRVLDALAAWAGISVASARATHRTLTADEIIALTASGRIEAGAHTVTHPQLPMLPDADQETEIADSRRTLEELVNRRIAGFAYPHGRYSPATVRHVRDAGFDYACAATPGPHPAEGPADTFDRFLLPRVAVPDCDGDAFLRDVLNGVAADDRVRRRSG